MSDAQKPKDPWSGRDGGSPPDLIELLNKFFSRKKPNAPKGDSPQPSSGDGDHEVRHDKAGVGILSVLAILIFALVWFLSGFFIVPPTDQAPVLRFGKYIETVGPGLHWVPRMVEAAYPVNVQSISAMNVSANMLTQDENIVSVEIAVQYRVADPSAYLFNVVKPEVSLQQVISSAMRQVIGQTTLDSILTTGRQQVRDDIEKVINSTLAQYHSGIEVTDVNLQPAKPPTAVTAAFDDAINAREDRQQYINKAQAYESKVVSMVKGQQARLIQDANAYKAKVVQQAKGDTARYLALLGPYRLDPAVMRDRMYFDTLSQLYANTTNVIDTSNGRQMLYLPLNQMDHGATKAAANKVTVPYSSLVPIAAKASVPSVLPYDNQSRPSYGQGGQ